MGQAGEWKYTVFVNLEMEFVFFFDFMVSGFFQFYVY